MNLTVHFLEPKKIRLILTEDDKIFDTLDFSFSINLDTLLIETVDKFLKKNRIEPLSLHRITVAGDVDKNSSAYTVVKTWISAVEGFN
ncbi:MAG: hypothetical protein Q8P35_02610 [Candidatus Yanofskybacteria bacterium]|nr:hypothetical protein [Candidatus Yanofskybacteria bacterium]